MLDSITAAVHAPKQTAANNTAYGSSVGVGVGRNLAWGLTLACASYVSGHGTRLHRVTSRLMRIPADTIVNWYERPAPVLSMTSNLPYDAQPTRA